VNKNQSLYLFCYSRHLYGDTCLCACYWPGHNQILVAAQKCHTKHYSFLTKSNQQSPSCCHMVRAGLYNSHHANFLFYVSLGLTASKDIIRLHSGMMCYTKHYSMLAMKSVLFSHHISCFSGHIFTNISKMLDCYLATYCTGIQTHQHITSTSTYLDHVRVSDGIDTQKSTDHEITAILPYMLLMMTKVL
jgi:hypothetical protein